MDCGYTVAAHQLRSFLDIREYITYNRTPHLLKVDVFLMCGFLFILIDNQHFVKFN